ncbi:MAG: hypothetical protein ACRD0K_19215 [Egibacteraceae bacterium]
MDFTLLVIGLICLAAAVVGGGLKLAGAEVPALTTRRQILLAVLGIAAVAINLLGPDFLGGSTATSTTPQPSPFTQADCSGDRIENIPIHGRETRALLGYVEIYYASGTNCARIVSSTSTVGESKYMEIRLVRCAETAPGDTCTQVAYAENGGISRSYAGPVRVDAANVCVSWYGKIEYATDTGEVEADPRATRCD